MAIFAHLAVLSVGLWHGYGEHEHADTHAHKHNNGCHDGHHSGHEHEHPAPAHPETCPACDAAVSHAPIADVILKAPIGELIETGVARLADAELDGVVWQARPNARGPPAI